MAALPRVVAGSRGTRIFRPPTFPRLPAFFRTAAAFRATALVIVAASVLAACQPASQEGPTAGEGYDVVILNGRVIDPETGLDAVRNVGVAAGRIEAVTTEALEGDATIDATGLIVSPGFIDLHTHGQTPENYRAEALDGVTSTFELEVGTADVDAWYAEREGQALINHGVSAGHIPARIQVMGDPGVFLPTGPGATQEATAEQIQEMADLLEEGLTRGALAVGFGLQYTPGASRWEVLEMFRVAARHQASAHVHIRYMGLQEPTNAISATEEVIAAAAVTGAPLHIVHLASSGLGAVPYLLQMVEGAQAEGLDVTTEAYPYTAGMTGIESAMFAEGWQDVLGIGYGDLEWAATGERLTPETFARYRQEGGMVILHFIPTEAMEAAVTSPLVMIASDGRLEGGRGHPRSAGTYAKILDDFVAEAGAFGYVDAIRKMSLMPAQRLEARVPAMLKKGRIQVGADADLTIFDPSGVEDHASYAEPAAPPTGIPFVLVNGVPVVFEGEVVEGVTPGKAVRAPVTQ